MPLTRLRQWGSVVTVVILEDMVVKSCEENLGMPPFWFAKFKFTTKSKCGGLNFILRWVQSNLKTWKNEDFIWYDMKNDWFQFLFLPVRDSLFKLQTLLVPTPSLLPLCFWPGLLAFYLSPNHSNCFPPISIFILFKIFVLQIQKIEH